MLPRPSYTHIRAVTADRAKNRLRTLAVWLLVTLLSITMGAQQGTRGLGVVVKTASGQAQQVKIYDKSIAIVIGINRFADPGIPQLRNAERDARGVKAVLERDYAFDSVIGIYNEQATKAGILKGFNDISQKLGKNDALFVFIASHGKTVNDVGFVIPHDGSFVNPFVNLSMTELKDVIAPTVNAKHLFFIIDTCFSGTMLKRDATAVRSGREYEALVQMSREPVSYALTAGDAGQTVLDGGRDGHSVFTGRLIQDMTDTRDFVTASELSTNIARTVVQDSRYKGHQNAAPRR